MIKIENVDVFGWEAAIRGMRNPLESWKKSDSRWGCVPGHTYPNCGEDCRYECEYIIGENDLTLMKKLCKAGTDHRKFMRMINVTMDITAPRYWWAEYDTYKVGTVANSCSTMHKIHEKELTLDDFSHEHLCEGAINELNRIIEFINFYRDGFNSAINPEEKKKCWWQMIQLLPSSYNQRRTVQLNYEVLRNMYHARKNHKLDCWRTFCKWVETLPYAELITGVSNDREKCGTELLGAGGKN